MDDNFISNINKIYLQTRKYFEDNSIYDWAKPKALNGEVGFCILYTRPIFSPNILIVGQNPSSFHPSNEKSDEDALMMSGNIPKINSYIKHEHLFAKKIKEVFSYKEEKELLNQSVGMNIWYAQGSKFNKVKTKDKDKLKEFCKSQTYKIINLLKPKCIFVSGFAVFDELNNQNIHNNTMKFKNDRIYEEGKLGHIPIYGCAHLTGAHIDAEEVMFGAKNCITNIKDFLNN